MGGAVMSWLSGTKPSGGRSRCGRSRILRSRQTRRLLGEQLEDRRVLATHFGTLTGNETWNADEIHEVTADVIVPATLTLTIEPGAIVKFHSSSDDLVVDGTLNAQGTAAQSIIFTSIRDDVGEDTNGDGEATLPGPGDWGQIEINGNATLSHTLVRYGGQFFSGSQIEVNGGNLTLTDSTVSESATVGVRMVGSNSTLTNNSYVNNAVAGASMDLNSNPAISRVTVTGNGINGLQVDGGVLSRDLVWDNPDIVYWMTDDVTVPVGTTLQVDAGQIVKPAHSAVDLIIDGTLNISGTISQPVVFTSAGDDTRGGDTNGDGLVTAPAPGDWGLIDLRDDSSGNTIDHLQSSYGGQFFAGTSLLATDTDVSISNSTFDSSESDGIRLQGTDGLLTNNVFTSNVDAAISMDLNSNPTISGVTISGNGINGLQVNAGVLARDLVWDDPDIVYWLTDDVTVPMSTTLQIDAGQIVKPAHSAVDLIIDGTLNISGTTSQPVVFTSAVDDTWGDDTNGDSQLTTPAAGDWGLIDLRGDSSGNTIDHLQSYYGGQFFAGTSLLATDTDVSISNSAFDSSESDGIRVQGTDAVLTNNVFTRNVDAAVSMDLDSNPTISGVTISGNGINGLQVDAGVFARDLVWDDPDIVYWLTDDVTVPVSTTLQIDAGQIIKPAHSAVDLNVDGHLAINGTVQSPVIISSRHDDSAGGDTNNNGDATAPAVGDWARVLLRGSVGNTIDHADLRYGGDFFGGAVVVDGGSLTMANSRVHRSDTNAVLTINDAEVNLTNNVLVDSLRAGILAASGSQLLAINNTIDGNARGVVSSEADTEVELTNNLITFSSTAGVVSEGGGGITLAFNDVFNPAGENYSGVADLTGTNGNLAADPKYFNADNAQYTLRSGSPAIDSGTSAGAPALDIQGNPRFDDPNAPNTGAGVPNYYDRGAFERQEISFSDVDLIAENVSGPTVGSASDTITVNWTVRNLGAGSAIAPWYDTIYVSHDPAWSPDDQFIGRAMRPADLAPGASYDAAADLPLTGVVPGNYYLIVVANGSSDVFEGIAVSNNAATSMATMNFAIPELLVGTPLQGNFTAGDASRYYQIDVEGGRTLSVELDSAASTGAVELYLRRGAVPTRSDYDFRFETLQADQEVVVPLTQPGMYFVLAYGNSGQAATSAFTISAQYAGFDIRRVVPSEGANAGRVTIAIDGNQLPPDTQAFLVSPAGTATAAAAAVYENAARIHPTFDLTGLDVGDYDVRIVSNGSEATLEDAFTVTTGSPGRIETWFNAPGAVRPGREGTVTVEYANVGDTDIAAPIIVVQAENANLRWPDSEIFVGSTVHLLGTSTTGPAGVLPPGHRERVNLRFRPTINEGVVDFDVTAIGESEAPIDWSDFKDDLQPSFVTLEGWDAVWENFMASVGSTARQYAATLAENATYLGQLGHYTRNADELLAFEVNQAGNWFDASAPQNRADLTVPTPGLALSFARTFMPSIAGRYHLGSLGRSWAHGWDISASTDVDGTVRIQNGVGHRLFQLGPLGRYTGVPGDHGQLSVDAGAVRVREPNGFIMQFRDDGRLDYVEDTNGNRITAGYTGDQLTSLTHSSGEVLTIRYNGFGRIREIETSEGILTTYSYDASGEHLESVDGPNGTEQYTYITDSTAVREHALASVTDIDGIQTVYEYDAQGRLLSERINGLQYASYSYPSPASIEIASPSGATTFVFFDATGNIAQVDAAQDGITQFRYDSAQNVTSVVGPDGSTTTFAYDGRGNLGSWVDQLGRQVHATYDTAFGRLLNLRDANGNATYHHYDDSANLDVISYAGGSDLRYEYDDLGNLITSTNGRGQQIDYTYDDRGQLLAKRFPDGTSASYTYDANGNLLTATGPSGTTTFTYDTDNLLTRMVEPSGRFLDYTYNSDGVRTRIESQDGYAVNYEYDDVGRLLSLRDGSDELLVAYSYGENGLLARAEMGNGTVTTYEYDSADRLEQLVNENNGGGVLSRFDYTYDSVGRIASVGTLDGTSTYSYDPAGQLTEAVLPDGRVIEYRYDAAGNRISVTDSGATTTYFANTLNQYVTAGTTSYVYDDDGNLVSKTDGGQTWTYSYDFENRLSTVTAPNGETTFYRYDALGTLLSRSVNGQESHFVTDPFGLGDIVAEYADDGSLIARYNHGLGLVNRINAANSAAYYAFDARGNTSHLTAPDGSELNRYAYLPFGKSVTATESVPNPFQFAGQDGVMTEASGLHYMRARFYDANMGRFISRDPIGIGGGLNLYTYTNNDPVNYADPSGQVRTFLQTLRTVLIHELRLVHGQGLYDPAYGTGELMQLARASGLDVTALKARANWYVAEYAQYRAHLASQKAAAAARAAAITRKVAVRQAVQSTAAGSAVGGFLFTAKAALLTPVAAAGGAAVGTAVAVGGTIGVGIGYAMERYDIFPGFRRAWGEYWFQICAALGFDYCNPRRVKLGVVASRDPNDILGPPGFGDEHWLAIDPPLQYTIRFENADDASAAAQEVFVTNPLDPDMDWSTFELSDIGFGSHLIQVPPGLQYFETTVATTNEDESPLWVRIFAELNLDTGIASWTFRSLDPGTGELPEDVFAGLLPPNDETHRGEGFVGYVVRSASNLATGDRIDNEASIVFDVNEAIMTPPIFNTIDSGNPTSTVMPLEEAYGTAEFTVNWSGQDDVGGSGVASYDVFVSEDGGAFEPWLLGTTAASAVFTNGVSGSTYGFVSRARDNVGHVEPIPTIADSETLVIIGAWINPTDKYDVNDRDGVTALDALLIINELARESVFDPETGILTPLPPDDFAPPYYDVTGDGKITALDALRVINQMARIFLGSASDNAESADSLLVLSAPTEPGRITSKSTRSEFEDAAISELAKIPTRASFATFPSQSSSDPAVLAVPLSSCDEDRDDLNATLNAFADDVAIQWLLVG